MNILSLFDGMSCGQQAINRIGVKDYIYYASEIKPHAIDVTQYNYPNTIQLGDVTKLDTSKLPKIDLLLGGSPCQDFSRGNKERLGLNGVKSGLFYEYLRILKEVKPKYFLLENVVMGIEESNNITKLLGVMPVGINSSLVSGQLRDRYYWTNIPGEEKGLFENIIGLPPDKNIKLNDIIDNGYSPGDKARCLLESDSRPLATPSKMFHRYYSAGFTTLVFRDKQHFLDCKKHYDSNFKKTGAKGIDEYNGDLSIYSGTRYLNQNELEQLQTVETGYTKILDRNNAACLLGDGWTVDVIAHILRGLVNG